jgi:hypothetical protein
MQIFLIEANKVSRFSVEFMRIYGYCIIELYNGDIIFTLKKFSRLFLILGRPSKEESIRKRKEHVKIEILKTLETKSAKQE